MVGLGIEVEIEVEVQIEERGVWGKGGDQSDAGGLLGLCTK